MSVPKKLKSVPEELKRELLAEFDKHLDAVRGCSMKPGSLELILTRAAQRMARLTQETLAKAASQEADFPPSGVPALRRGASVDAARDSARSDDGVGEDRL